MEIATKSCLYTHIHYLFLVCFVVLIKLVSMGSGGIESLENKARPVVDVRDVAEASLLAYEKPEAKGRYICTSYVLRMQDLVNKLKSLYPNYNYPKR